MQICRRLVPLSVFLAALVVFAGFQSGPRPAVADSFATVQGCTPASSPSGAYSCTLTLTMGIGPGGVWEATPSDSTAGITSCDGTNAGAICTASVGSAIFVCKVGCPPNSTYTDIVSGSAAQAGAQYFTVLNPGGTPPVNANAPANTAQTQPTYTPPSTTQTTYTQPVRVSVPAPTAIASPASYQTLVTTTSGVGGGQCVGGSIPTNLGCTALGVGGYGVGSYGLGGYGLGGYGGGCFGQLYGCGTSFNVGGGCGFFTGLGAGGCNNFGFNNFGFNNGGFNNCGNFGFNNCNGFNNRFGGGFFNGLNNANCTTLFGPNCTNLPTCPAGQQYRFFLQKCA